MHLLLLLLLLLLCPHLRRRGSTSAPGPSVTTSHPALDCSAVRRARWRMRRRRRLTPASSTRVARTTGRPYVLRVFPLCALVPRVQGSSGAVSTVQFVWRGHAKTPPLGPGRGLTLPCGWNNAGTATVCPPATQPSRLWQSRTTVSTRILGRRTAPFSPPLNSNRVPHGFTPRS